MKTTAANKAGNVWIGVLLGVLVLEALAVYIKVNQFPPPPPPTTLISQTRVTEQQIRAEQAEVLKKTAGLKKQSERLMAIRKELDRAAAKNKPQIQARYDQVVKEIHVGHD